MSVPISRFDLSKASSIKLFVNLARSAKEPGIPLESDDPILSEAWVCCSSDCCSAEEPLIFRKPYATNNWTDDTIVVRFTDVTLRKENDTNR